MSRDRREAGFSLMELMISLAVMGVLMIYLMQTFSAQQRTYVMVDQVTEAQQNLRAISDLIEREIRLSGFMIDEGGAVCGVDATNGADTLFVSDASAIDPSTAIQPTLGARTSTAPALGAVTITLTNGDTGTLDGQPAYDTDNNGVNDSDFRPGAGVIVYDRNNPSRGTACGIIQAGGITATTLRVNFLTPGLGGAAAGAQLVVVPAHVYQVNAGTAQLLRDGDVLSEDVEDLQVAYFFDNNANFTVTDNGESRGTGTTALTTYTPSALDNANLREMRVNFVARTRGTDPGYTRGVFQTTENRAAPAATATDPQTRRRVHTTTVRVRNVGNRGLLG